MKKKALEEKVRTHEAVARATKALNTLAEDPHLVSTKKMRPEFDTRLLHAALVD